MRRVARHRGFESYHFRQGENMLITQIILTIIMYWVLMGIGVAVIMALFYGLAVVLGELAEWLRQRQI